MRTERLAEVVKTIEASNRHALGKTTGIAIDSKPSDASPLCRRARALIED
jgi:hypothetical protein